ncbi:MAG: hypothetical protein M1822_006877 [Bathelium mastoideum]|nr:MAG: hypothetical protein M1822_006877 [Bathelium mastoideum]
MSNAKAPTNAQSIEINGRVVKPTEHYARDARETEHIIITVKDVLTNKQKVTLLDKNVEFQEDLGNNNLLCRYVPTDLTPLRSLDFVKQVDVYRNLYKIPAALEALAAELDSEGKLESEAYPIDVMVHHEVTDVEALADDVARATAVDRSQMIVTSDQIRLEVELGKLERIAADDRVRILQEVVTPMLLDDQAKRIVFAPAQLTNESQFRGKDQTIAVCDSGFDLGSIEDCHPAFSGKIAGLIAIGRDSDTNKTEAEKTDDHKGHGTHVCGTIVGREIETSQGLVGGIAPDARLVVSSLQKRNGDLINVKQIRTLYEVPYKAHNARIFSNSWGNGLGTGRRQLPYDDKDAVGIDKFVRDNPDALVIFSAGNNNLNRNQRAPGTQEPSIGSQAAAKNCLTVGASGSTRTIDDSRLDSIGPNYICSESSRGPTLEKRIKPDIVAPGFNIFSVHTRHDCGENVSGAEATSKSFPGVKWKLRSGTSHATPLVSGCAAILREVLESKRCPNPPAALLKAVLINGADRLPGIDTGPQGFGRVNLQSSTSMLQIPPISSTGTGLPPLPSVGGTLIGPPLRHGECLKITLAPPANPEGLELKVTMVYNDLSGRAIQNNLNLAVIDETTSETKHGGLSEDDIDVQNNVEQVVWHPAPKREVVVRVSAQKILGTETAQDFVLAWAATKPFGGSNEKRA